MANNNEKESYANSLKASFCRQQFPFLLQFLKHFDLSDIHSGHDYSLNMDFLLQSYSHLDGSPENISHRKETCCWILKDVNKEDVLLAIDEYFDITDKNDYLAEQRNKLLFNVVRSKREIQYSFDDNTTLSILNYFNIIKPEKIKELEKRKKGEKLKVDIGKQKGFFSDFIACPSEISQNKDYNNVSKYDNEVGEKIPEYSFVNAFHLLGSLRNWGSHDIENYSNGETHLFYRYIIYTHIGITYMCRHFWNKHKDTLIENGYVWPEIMDNCNLKEDVIKVIVKGVNEGQLITSCNYIIGKGDPTPVNFQPARKIEFDISIKKFTSIIVNVICDGKNYNIEKYISYYGWNKLFIEIEPPERVHGHFDGIAGDDKEIETLISKLFSDFEEKNKKAGEDMMMKIASFWDKIEPILQQQRDFISKELSEKEQNLKEELHNSFKLLIGKLQKDNAAVMNGFANLDKNMQGTNRALKEIDKHNKKIELVDFVKKHFIAFVFLLFSIGAFVISYRNDLSMAFIQQSWWMIIIEIAVLLVILASFLCIWSSHKTTTQPRLLRPAYKFAGWSLAGLTTFFFILAFLVIPIKTPKGLVENFDYFAEHESGDIAKAAKIMEDYYADNPDNEDAKIKLARYYINYEGDHDKAYELLKEMVRNPEKFNKGIDVIAEILYEQGDYAMVIKIIEKYKKEKSPVITRIEGLMNAYHYGDKQNLDKSLELLETAANQGDVAAMYWLGHIYSNVVGKWVYSYKEGEKEEDYSVSDYDLVYAIERYKEAVAHNFPMAAIELGNIFYDLNMNDQAKYYFERALDLTDKTLLDESRYRMGLLYERLGVPDNEYMEAVETSYEPAILYAALRNDTTAQIYYDELEKRGGYKGHLYIPPIVLNYIKQHDTKKALYYLNKYRPEANFNEKFVEAMDDICSLDSIAQTRGKQTMRSLAGECKYANMLSIFWELRDLTKSPQNIHNNVSYMLSKIKELDKIGEEIHFAYVIAAWILKDMGIEYINKSNMYAQKAINRNHPAGGFILSYMPQSYSRYLLNKIESYYLSSHPYKEVLKVPYDYNSIKDINGVLSIAELALRTSPGGILNLLPINIGQKSNKLLSVFFKNLNAYNLTSDCADTKSCSKKILDFWTDVAIANNDIVGECYMLYLYDEASNGNEQFELNKRKRLIEALLEDLTLYSAPIIGNDYNFISLQLKNMPNDFIDVLAQKYDSIPLIKSIINNRNLSQRFILIGNEIPHFNYSDWFYQMFGDKGLFDEFCLITDKHVKVGWGNGKMKEIY